MHLTLTVPRIPGTTCIICASRFTPSYLIIWRNVFELTTRSHNDLILSFSYFLPSEINIFRKFCCRRLQITTIPIHQDKTQIPDLKCSIFHCVSKVLIFMVLFFLFQQQILKKVSSKLPLNF